VPDTGTTSGLTRGADGFFYGTTEGAEGNGFGLIFRIGESGGEGQVLHVLARADGYAHTGEMIQARDGKFYGTARAGGEYATFEGGTIFQFVAGADQVSSTYSRIYSFAENDLAGSEPYAGLAEGADGLLYGTTIRTGASRTFVGVERGSIFSLNPLTFVVTPLHTFDSASEGSPRGPLVESSAGQFLGTTYYGGPSGFGAIFRLTISNATTTGLTASPVSAVFGQQIALQATVTSAGGTPTGLVDFLDGNATIGTGLLSGGAATLNTTSVAVGTHTLTASYQGDSTFLSSTSPHVSVTVGRAAATTTLASSPNPSARKQVVSLTATIAAVAPGAGAATGQVQFFDGKKKLGTASLVNGIATLQTAFNGMGGHDLTATYGGDPNFTPSASPVFTHTVNR
jgi:uncharacterized repeat protein (TIGR03803 family)